MRSLPKGPVFRSLAYAVVLSLAAYALAWGFFITHQEVEVSTRAPVSIAAWTFVVVFVGNLILSAARSAGARKH